MKIVEKEKAKELRRSGFSYKEILDQLSVSIGSLNYWLRDIKLTDDQEKRIYDTPYDELVQGGVQCA